MGWARCRQLTVCPLGSNSSISRASSNSSRGPNLSRQLIIFLLTAAADHLKAMHSSKLSCFAAENRRSDLVSPTAVISLLTQRHLCKPRFDAISVLSRFTPCVWSKSKWTFLSVEQKLQVWCMLSISFDKDFCYKMYVPMYVPIWYCHLIRL